MRTYALLAGLLLLSGCATILSGTEEDITFNSNPSGATVIIDGISVGTTPLTVEVDRPGLEDMEVTVQLDGYETRTFELDKEFNTPAILNIFVWPGFIVDAFTGALFRYDKTTYTVNMEDGVVTFNLHELPRGAEGQYLLPDHVAPIAVVDARTGLTIRFK